MLEALGDRARVRIAEVESPVEVADFEGVLWKARDVLRDVSQAEALSFTVMDGMSFTLTSHNFREGFLDDRGLHVRMGHVEVLVSPRSLWSETPATAGGLRGQIH
jgi:hypothetical protein